MLQGARIALEWEQNGVRMVLARWHSEGNSSVHSNNLDGGYLSA
jgi:hypothetical protein